MSKNRYQDVFFRMPANGKAEAAVAACVAPAAGWLLLLSACCTQFLVFYLSNLINLRQKNKKRSFIKTSSCLANIYTFLNCF
jgi:uncharacterized membrane protein YjjP (DUF1212 family)